MRKKQVRKLEKKRKAARAARHQQPRSLAYSGNKYKKPEFVPLMHQAETAIYETYVISSRTLTDREVHSALERMILDLRRGRLAIEDNELAHGVEMPEQVEASPEGYGGFLIENIRRRWNALFTRSPARSSETLAGVLRTILGSMDVRKVAGASSQGYLDYIGGFLAKTGVTVQQISAEQAAELGVVEEDPEAEFEDAADELLAMGRAWRNGVWEAAESFRRLAAERLQEGDWESVVDCCETLLAEPGGAARIEIEQIGSDAHSWLEAAHPMETFDEE